VGQSRLMFKRSAHLVGALVGLPIIALFCYLAIDSILWFPTRFEMGDSHGKGYWFRYLDYETDGLLGFAISGGIAAFAMYAWPRRVHASISTQPALAIDNGALLIDWSLPADGLRQVWLEGITMVELMTSVKAIRHGWKLVAAASALGSGWAASRAAGMRCLVIGARQRGREYVIRVDAQWVAGGEAGLAQFATALRQAVDDAVPKNSYEREDVWISNR